MRTIHTSLCLILRPLCSSWASFLALIVVLVLSGLNSAETINPDAVSYVRIAEYWRDGQWALAINGYWGPLISWLMAPMLVWIDPPRALVAARIVMGFGAIVYFIAGLRFMRACGLPDKFVCVAAWVLVVFCAYWSVKNITPDLLMTGLIVLAISVEIGRGRQRGPWAALLAGSVYGMAYLAKAVALPIGLMLAIALPVLGRFERSATTKDAYREALMTLAGIAVVALPWIAVLSLHYGTPTFSTSSRINHALVGPAGNHIPSFETFHTPEAGRVTSWEEPSLMRWDYWSPFESREAFVRQFKIVYRSVLAISDRLKSLDLIGIGLGSALCALVLAIVRRGARRTESWWMALPIVACMTVVYLPVYNDESRYFLGCFPIMLASALGLLGVLEESSRYSGVLKALGVRRPLFLVVPTIVVLGSFVAPYLGDALSLITRPAARIETFREARDLQQSLAKYGKTVDGVASIGLGNIAFVAYYLSFLERAPFCGSGSADNDLGALLATPANIVLVDVDQLSSPGLARDPRFRLVHKVASRNELPGGMTGLEVYEIVRRQL